MGVGVGVYVCLCGEEWSGASGGCAAEILEAVEGSSKIEVQKKKCWWRARQTSARVRASTVQSLATMMT